MSQQRHTEQAPHADALLASVLRAADGAAAAGCPDAEVIGLFAEGGLAGAELGAVEAHVHVCPRCQATVAAFVRALPDEPAVPGTITEALGGGGFATWFSGWRWLVPATSLAAVALVAVWVGRGPADQVAESARGPATSAVDAAAPAGEPAEPKVPEAFVPPAGAGDTVAGLTQQRRTTPVTPAAPQVSSVDRREARSAEVASAAEADGAGAAMAGARGKSEARADARSRVAGVVANSAVARDAARAASAAPDPAREAAPLEETLNVAPAPAPPPPPPPAAVAPSAAPAFRANLAFSPWRVSEGRVERSRDSGRTWQRVTTPTGARIIEVASPGGDICWAIADDGVLRTTDGATWTRTARPTTERLAGIVATSAGEASVFTAAGARFVTTDGGTTWTQAP